MFEFIHQLSHQISSNGEQITRELLVANRWYCITETQKLDYFFTFYENGIAGQTENGVENPMTWKLSHEGILELFINEHAPLRLDVKSLGDSTIVMKELGDTNGVVLFTEEKAKEVLIPFLN